MPKGKGLLLLGSPSTGESGGEDEGDEYGGEQAVDSAAKALAKLMKAEGGAVKAAFRRLHDAEHAYMDDMEEEDM